MDTLQGLLILAAVFMCVCARGLHRDWVLLALALPAARLVFSRAFRARFSAFVRRRRAEIAAFRKQGDRLPLRATAAFVVIPMAVISLLGLNAPGPGEGDPAPVIPSAVRLIRHGDLRLDEHLDHPHSSLRIQSPDNLPYYLVRTDSGVYSAYPAGMVALALPFVTVSSALGVDWWRPNLPGRIEKWTATWIAALSTGMFFLIALHLVSPGPALSLTAFVALGSSVLSTAARDLSQQSGLLFWFLLLLLAEFRRVSWRPAIADLVQGIACAMMLACRPSAAIIIACFGVWTLVRSPARAVRIGAIAALAFAPWSWFYWSTYGMPLGPTQAQADAALWARPAEHLIGVLASPARGVFVYHPWLILAVAGLGFRRPAPEPARVEPPGWRWFVVSAFAFHLLLVSSWGMWWGGHGWGPRLMLEVLIPLGLLATGPVERLWCSVAGRAGLALLGALSAAVHFPAVYGGAMAWNHDPVDVDHYPERVWSWRDAPFLRPFQPADGPPRVPENRRD